MTTNNKITLYHAPQSRSRGTLTLLKELRTPFELHVLNMKAGEQRQPEYLAVNPMGKVPAILHGDVLVTEQVAIFLYLADLFPQEGLAPRIGDSMRGPYLRWMIYYAACYEPALVDKGMKRDPAPLAMSPYGDFDTMFATINEQLAKGTYLLGDRLSAADILWGMALSWGIAFKLVPETPTISNYVARMTARPSFVEVAAMDAELAAEHEAAFARAKGG